MTIESASKAYVRKALDLAPLDMLLCEYCGHEIYIPTETGSEVKCFRCGRTMDKSHFSPMIRKQKLWVSEKGIKLRLEQYSRRGSCTCVTCYRDAARFRRALFHIYDNEGQITYAQALAMLVAFWAGSGKGVLKLLGRHSQAMKQVLTDGDSTGKDAPDSGLLWRSLESVQIREQVGRPARTDTLVLFLDTVVLMFCPNRYVHFLRDALRLRSHEYKVRANRASAHQESWRKFWKAKRAVEVSCKRKWRAWWGENPETPPENWWERVARQQGLIG